MIENTMRNLYWKTWITSVALLLSLGSSFGQLNLDLGVHQRDIGNPEIRVPVWVDGPGSFSGMNMRVELKSDELSDYKFAGAEWGSGDWLDQIPVSERELVVFTGGSAMEVQWTSWSVDRVNLDAGGQVLMNLILTRSLDNPVDSSPQEIALLPHLIQSGLESEFLNEAGEIQPIALRIGKITKGSPALSVFNLPRSISVGLDAAPNWDPVWISEVGLSSEWSRNGAPYQAQAGLTWESGVYEWRLQSTNGQVVFTGDPAVLGRFGMEGSLELQISGSHLLINAPVGLSLRLETALSLDTPSQEWEMVEELTSAESPRALRIPDAYLTNPEASRFFRLVGTDAAQ
jgi:hypothetical protein